ncbi:alginate lyase family protein [Pseudomonas gingeri]|uniref:alginate lyase family protein n=1 Tax=Pseudomonas gingeri TaxID=117681 RepID=UPI0015A0E6FF|nr:alginate lyase family protein [Pseudomonas gingeri]NWA24573.1 alginate lyase family protein [Pseudomonas gingeri]
MSRAFPGTTAWALGICATLVIPFSSAASTVAASPQIMNLCQPAATSPSAKQLLAAAKRHLDDGTHALPHLHTEGTLPNQGIREQSIAAEKDWPVLRQAALAWRLSADPQYLRQVDEGLANWTRTYQPDFNPIDETNIDQLIDAYTLTATALRPETQEASRAFLRQLGNGYLAQIRQFHDSKSSKNINNWQSHRVKLVTMAAAALVDRAMLEQAFQLFQQQVADNLLPDGSVFDFRERDALHYVVYDLEPLVQAALAARPYGIGGNWLAYTAPTGAALGRSLDWLTPYASGQRSHQEFVHTSVKFDRDRANVGEAGYSGAWEPKSSNKLYWLAAQLDARYLPLARQLAPNPQDWIGACYLK